MRRGSIRLRLWSAAAVSIILALGVAGLGLRYLFERHVERRVEAELAVRLDQLVGATTRTSTGITIAAMLTDPRLEKPLSGYYWQVEDLSNHSLIRSRSLWDGVLVLPSAPGAENEPRLEEVNGPGGELLIALERTIADSPGASFRAAVAETHATVEDSLSDYMNELTPALVLLAGVLIAANFIEISVGLAPLESLRIAVRDVAARRSRRLEVAAPIEVQPLADEIDRLLAAQEKALTRARSRATDLAHGLKTPLQVLSSDVRALREKGEGTVASGIEKSVAAIRRHIERELARARLAPDLAVRMECRIAETAKAIIDVVRRTPDGERLSFAIEVPDGLTAPIEEADLSETLGNLIENAARFAVCNVRVSAAAVFGGVTISVADDGLGIPDAEKTAALERGVRLDSNGGGTGLGLAIVADIVEAYGGTLSLSDAQPGLDVTVFLPTQS